MTPNISQEQLKPTPAEDKAIVEVREKLEALLKINELSLYPSTILTGDGGIIHKMDLVPNRVIKLSRELAKQSVGQNTQASP